MFHLIWSIIVGFLIGLVARALLPGVDHMGFWMTVGIGIVGSLIGGVIGGLIRRPPPGTTFHPAGFLLSVVGSIILLLVLRHVQF